MGGQICTVKSEREVEVESRSREVEWKEKRGREWKREVLTAITGSALILALLVGQGENVEGSKKRKKYFLDIERTHGRLLQSLLPDKKERERE